MHPAEVPVVPLFAETRDSAEPAEAWVTWPMAMSAGRWPLADRATSFPTSERGSRRGGTGITPSMNRDVMLNMGFDQRVVIDANLQDWVRSPT